MSKANALAGLIGNYGDSDDDSDGGKPTKTVPSVPARTVNSVPPKFSSETPVAYSGADPSSTIHPPPIAHCPWSACYDETSGFTYYWNQHTNAVTWEAPPEYLMALKLAQQQLHASGSGEVSAEEWQLYQQALAEKQTAHTRAPPKPTSKASPPKPAKKTTTNAKTKKRRCSDDEDVKIELITSYHNSDSESNDEPDTPVKTPPPLPPVKPPKVAKIQKKPKKSTHKTVEFGPAMPPNQEYNMPIGPEFPPMTEPIKAPDPVEKIVDIPIVKENKIEEIKKVGENDDSQDEIILLTRLKDQAKLLEKLGGEIPEELQKIIECEFKSKPSSPKPNEENNKETKSITEINIDDLLEEIEKKELPKIKSKPNNIDMFSELKSNDTTPRDSPKPDDLTPPINEDMKPLFPSSINIKEDENVTLVLFPCSKNIPEIAETKEPEDKTEASVAVEKKGVNLYLLDSSEVVEKAQKKKLRISNSVLPVKKTETPSYTTKYSQSVDGFSGERTGLGFSKDGDEDIPKAAVSYGNGLMFTKGETLNEGKKEDDIDEQVELLEAKLKYLNQLQPCVVTPVQEMLIQLQALRVARSAGALQTAYWRGWGAAAAGALLRHERLAAPPAWRLAFCRSEGRYRYERESDGLVQWEYPADGNQDMDISTTPPPPAVEQKETLPQPGASLQPPTTPPPPAWEPPPPGTDDVPPPPLPKDKPNHKHEIKDELLSFYNDIAELEKCSSTPDTHTASNSPELVPPPPPEISERNGRGRERDREYRDKEHRHREYKDTVEFGDRERDTKEKDKDVKSKKKSKVKISSSIGMKQKSVSSLVAKWQQVADEIDSD